LISFMV